MASTEAAIGRDLRRLFDGGSVAGLGEAQLLDHVARRDELAESAFEAILTRHGPTVLACCRRVLGDSAAAEDAFQATFLVLFRRAGSIRVADSLAPWLLHVARLAAIKARESETRRRVRERRAARPEATPPRRRPPTSASWCAPRSIVCPRSTGTRSAFAISKAEPTTMRRRPSAGRPGRSAGGCRGRGSCCGSG